MVVVALSQKSNGLRYCFLEMIHKMVKMRIVSVIVANKRLDDAEMWGIDFSFSVIHLGRLLVTQPVVAPYSANSVLITIDLWVGLIPHTPLL